MDNLANLLTKIRNAKEVSHKKVIVPYSRLNFNLLELLAKKGLVAGVKKIGTEEKKKIELKIKYDKETKKSLITSLTQVSKPGRREYVPSDKLKRVLNGKGFGVYSTSKGLMTDTQARKSKIGGEYICEIW